MNNVTDIRQVRLDRLRDKRNEAATQWRLTHHKLKIAQRVYGDSPTPENLEKVEDATREKATAKALYDKAADAFNNVFFEDR